MMSHNTVIFNNHIFHIISYNPFWLQMNSNNIPNKFKHLERTRNQPEIKPTAAMHDTGTETTTHWYVWLASHTRHWTSTSLNHSMIWLTVTGRWRNIIMFSLLSKRKATLRSSTLTGFTDVQYDGELDPFSQIHLWSQPSSKPCSAHVCTVTNSSAVGPSDARCSWVI